MFDGGYALRFRLLVALVAFFPRIALASSHAGFAGAIYLMLSVPVGAMGFLATLIMCSKAQFRKPQVFIFYAAIWIVAFLMVLGLVRNETESFQIVFVGNGLFLLVILAPAFWQYHRSEKQSDSERIVDISNAAALLITANSILAHDWAPFGSLDALEQDHYKVYALRILSMLKSGAGAQELGDYLRGIEKKLATKRCSEETLYLIIAKFLALKAEIVLEVAPRQNAQH